MTFLPIADRELRVASRRPAAFWIRCLAALGCLLLWFFIAVCNSRLSSAQFSKLIFTTLSITAFGFCLLTGLFLTSDCLSEEKREGTIGLLFLTDLKGYDVVIGKLAATSLHAFYAVLAIFPVLALPLLMGGVTAGELGRLMLVLLASLFLSLSIGMLSSAIHQEARQSMAAALLALLVLTGVLPALRWFFILVLKTGSFDILLFPSPAFAFQAAYDSAYRLQGGSSAFWISLSTVFLMAGGFLLMAMVLLPRVWQEGTGILTFSGKLRTHSTTGNVRSAARSLLLDENPFFWLANRDRTESRLSRFSIKALTAVWFCFLLASITISRGKEGFIIALFSAYALHQLVKYFMAVEASRQLSTDRQSGALELLLVAPISEKSLLEGYSRAFRERFKKLTFLLIGVNTAMCLAVMISSNLSMNSDDRLIFFEIFAGGAIMLLLDFRAMEQIGLAQALRSRKHSRVVLGTLMRVVLPCWLAVFGIVFIMQKTVSSAQAAATLFFFWFLFGAVNDRVFQSAALRVLGKRIRALVSEPGSPAEVNSSFRIRPPVLEPAKA